jgi:hypothetical protein
MVNENPKKLPRLFRLRKWAAVTLVLCLTLVFILWLKRAHTIAGRRYSLSLETLTPGDLFSSEGICFHTGWDGPTGEESHGEIYGLKIGNRLLRFDIIDDPVIALKKRLPTTVPALLPLLSSKDPREKFYAGVALLEMGPAAQSAMPHVMKRYREGDQSMERIIIGFATANGTAINSNLENALMSPDPKIRKAAIQTLGELAIATTNSPPQPQ